MAANYVLLQRVTVGAAGATSVTFNNIPQTGYTDLKLVCTQRNTSVSIQDFNIKFNGVTTNLSERYLIGVGSGTPGSGSQSYAQIGMSPGTAVTANTFGSTEIYIPNYTSSNYKAFSSDDVTENNGTTAYQTMWAGLWSDTAAITSITLYCNNPFAQHSSFSLYGIAASTTPAVSSAAYATGGDIVVSDGTYWYHAFLSSSAFVPGKALNADIFVVAGGGGGGASFAGGGGGAGGVIYFQNQSLTTTSYPCIVGAGGTGNTGGVAYGGSNGNNSYFPSLTAAIGGGLGGGFQTGTPAYNGGSGGGGQYFLNTNNGPGGYGGTSTQTGTGATAYYGNAGGQGYAASGGYHVGAGGGGAGAGAANSGYNSPSTGGPGINTISAMSPGTLSNWFSATGLGVSGYIAGGGGASGQSTASSGGAGGGAAGSTGSSPSNAIANTGGGGGACGNTGGGAGSNGGSGVIIIRYAV